ncbi:hypothetical protein MCAG_01773 [Micromonospora sp. ATCC 39149]|uniref:Nucleotidyltransferase domain-containing protein n=1 Tax=Micromonospora carbonacea TaxID=47853 RepID=A0A7D6CDH1_9ACTN|nr:hypothetical protein [Micromonospora sp. ATCC 39149]EEP71446.1 hypothetical protein MCAG_01773 [Micromonospora sp. ATCC 39149]QLJ97709.1 hypothetical protein HZU44_23500 [Micromonospora carbonacea]
MFTPDSRENVRHQLVERAQGDSRITAAALTGSAARKAEDQWSDIDLFLGVTGGATTQVLSDWTTYLYDELGAVHHFDLLAGPATYRAFLLGDLLEVDLGFTPASAFGPVGDGAFEVLFGQAVGRKPAVTDTDHLAGRCWHHVLHAHVCIQRSTPWQAEYWISALRDNTLTLISHRLGHPGDFLKGADQLPAEATSSLREALVRGLDAAELSRALRSATHAFVAELRHHDSRLAAVLGPRLIDVVTG